MEIMTVFIVRLIVMTAAVAIAGEILPGIHVDGLWSAVIAALLLGILNAVVRPVLVILTFPLTIVTLGLFLLVINALMLLLVDWFMVSISIDSFWWALLGSLLISLVSWILNGFIGEDAKRSRG